MSVIWVTSRAVFPMTVSTLDRIRGTIFGGALGDAIGLFTEFLDEQEALEYYGPNPRFSLATPAPEGFVGCHQDPHRMTFYPAGWTDDTDQALLILLAFLRSGGQDVPALDFAARLRAWVEGGLRALDRLPLDVGMTVGAVVRSRSYLDDPVETARNTWERSGRKGAANGAVMRTGLLGCLIFLDKNGQGGVTRAMKAAISVAETTHADPRCLISCAIVSGAIAAIMRGTMRVEADLEPVVAQAKQILLKHDPPISQEHLTELDRLLNVSSLDDLHLDDHFAIGYTYKALGSGIWALRQVIRSTAQGEEEPSVAFERIITELTMAAGDADTNAAVAGPLIGCYLSSSGLPAHWMSELKDAEWLQDKCDAAFYLLAKSDRSLTPSFGDSRSASAAGGSDSTSPPTYTPSNPYNYLSDNDTLVDAGKGRLRKEALDAAWKAHREEVRVRLNKA